MTGDRPTIYNVAMTTSGTEYSQALPLYVRKFTFQLRGSNDCKFCFTSGESGTKYVTIKSGSSYSEEDLSSAFIITLYFQSPADSQVAEIIVWT